MATVIKDVNGKKLRLSKKWLTELEPSGDFISNITWRTTLADLLNNELAWLEITKDADDSFKGDEGQTLVRNSFENRLIGCHQFDRRTFALIRKAIKAAK